MSGEASFSAEGLEQAVELVHREAELLDAREFETWLSLFAEDAWLWMPASPDQGSPQSGLSLLFEDRRLLALRVRRLGHPAILVDSPPQRSHHHVSAVRARRLASGLIEASSSQLIIVHREGEQMLMSARCLHALDQSNGALLIRSKTVRLLDCDAPRRGFAVPL